MAETREIVPLICGIVPGSIGPNESWNIWKQGNPISSTMYTIVEVDRKFHQTLIFSMWIVLKRSTESQMFLKMYQFGVWTSFYLRIAGLKVFRILLVLVLVLLLLVVRTKFKKYHLEVSNRLDA